MDFLFRSFLHHFFWLALCLPVFTHADPSGFSNREFLRLKDGSDYEKERIYVTFQPESGLSLTAQGDYTETSSYDSSTVRLMLETLDATKYSRLSWSSVLGYVISVLQKKKKGMYKDSFSIDASSFFGFAAIQNVFFSDYTISRNQKVTDQRGYTRTITTLLLVS